MHTRQRIFLCVIVFLALSSCATINVFAPAVTPTPTNIPELVNIAGDYYCMGHEYGLIAALGYFSITGEGKFSDGYNTWSLVPTEKEHNYAFIDHPDFETLIVIPEDIRYRTVFNIFTKPGETVAHAEGGNAWCDPKDK